MGRLKTQLSLNLTRDRGGPKMVGATHPQWRALDINMSVGLPARSPFMPFHDWFNVRNCWWRAALSWIGGSECWRVKIMNGWDCRLLVVCLLSCYVPKVTINESGHVPRSHTISVFLYTFEILNNNFIFLKKIN